MSIFPASSFVPVVLGFFGLGVGYLIYGPQELLGYPHRDPKVDRANGVWGLWMAGSFPYHCTIHPSMRATIQVS